MKLFRLYLILILFQGMFPAYGQEQHLKYFDIDKGLSNNSVVTIFQDSEEFMWFGTYDGLNRFDGYNFKVYRNVIGDTTSLAGNSVYSIAADAHNNLWVGGARGACRLYKNSDTFGRLFFYSKRSGKKEPVIDIVHRIKKTGSTKMLIGTQRSGVICFNNENSTGIQLPLFYKGRNIYDYDAETIEYIAEKNYCWISVRDIGICRLDLGTMKHTVVYPSTQRIYSMLRSKANDNDLWVGTESGLFLLDAETKQLDPNRMPGKSIVSNIFRDRQGLLWIATDGHGIFTYHCGDDRAKPYITAASQPLNSSNSFFSIYEDRQGNFWFGSLRGGISLVGNDRQRFSHVQCSKSGADNTPDNYILSFCEADNNNLWIGTDGAGLKYWDRKNNTFKAYKAGQGLNSLSGNFITGITKGNENDLWISTWQGGVNRLNARTGRIDHFTCYNPVTGITERNAWLVFKDRDNKIWVSATNEGSLYRFNEQKQVFDLFNKDIHNLQSLTQTRDGSFWGGNYSTLLNIDIVTRKIKKYELGYPVRSVLESRDGNLWIGTQEGGLLLFNRKKGNYTRYTTTDGLPGNTVLRILEDKDGNLWMSTYNGLSRFDKIGNFKNFSVSDGLQSSQFSFNAGTVLSSGEMAFGGINGFNIFDPEKIINVSRKRAISLNGMWLNNKPLQDNSPFVTLNNKTVVKALELPYDQTSLSLDFVTLDYLHPDKISYSYMLEGWDDHWNYIDNLRKANYSRLQAGNYVFKVRTKNDDGTWATPVTLATVTVLPPWYSSVWAYMAYAMVISAGIYGYMRYAKSRELMRYKVRLAQLEGKKEKELAEKQQEMFTYVSHEFRTPLSLIINPLRRAVKKPIDENPDLPNDLAVAHRNARRLLSLVDQLLLFRKAESNADELKISALDLKHLCNEVYQCFVNQAKEQGIDFVLDVQGKAAKVFGDYEKIEIALFNLTSNAFKHTDKGGKIVMKLEHDENTATISISDTGCGISDTDLPHIFEKFRRVNNKPVAGSGFGVGLYIVKYFAEKHHGSISCVSKQGVGSTFSLRLLKGYDQFADMPINAISPKMSELVEELLGDSLKNEEPENKQETPAVSDPEIISDKKSLLIVEDNEEMRSYLVSLFSSAYIVYSAGNGREGYTLTMNNRPDIIISDISMKEMDGLELCRKVKETPELSHLPVILLTATSSPEIHLKGISEGADDYITKPFDSDILTARVDTLLKSRNHLRNYFLDNITLRDNGSKVPAEYKDFLKKCIDIIEANLDNADFTIKTFAQEIGMSHRSLYEKIKQISGQTLNAFMRSVRLRRAALLMLTQDINIAQAALMVGFEDPQYFRQQFVKQFGMTPSDYIKRYKPTFNEDLNVIK